MEDRTRRRNQPEAGIGGPDIADEPGRNGRLSRLRIRLNGHSPDSPTFPRFTDISQIPRLLSLIFRLGEALEQSRIGWNR
jgi:hypothetical protein